MKGKKVLIFFVFSLFFSFGCFSQLWCDIDFGCWIAPDWSPTFPNPNSCHASSPENLHMYARSVWTNGDPAPTQWHLELRSYFSNSDDCFLNGCHKHERVSTGDAMLHSIGGLQCEGGGYANSLDMQERYFFTFEVAKPEASGVISLCVRCRIPAGADKSRVLEYNPGWQFDPIDPEHNYIFTVIPLPYLVADLIELPDSNDYIKASNLSNHVHHQFYGTPTMVDTIQRLASYIRNEYHNQTQKWVKLSFNDMSLEYGGIFDLGSNWDCPHIMHREGKSVDLNTTQCLVCDGGQQDCENKSSSDYITLRHKDGTEETLTVKDWIDRVARGRRYNLHEWHNGANDYRIHLDLVPIPQ